MARRRVTLLRSFAVNRGVSPRFRPVQRHTIGTAPELPGNGFDRPVVDLRVPRLVFSPVRRAFRRGLASGGLLWPSPGLTRRFFLTVTGFGNWLAGSQDNGAFFESAIACLGGHADYVGRISWDKTIVLMHRSWALADIAKIIAAAEFMVLDRGYAQGISTAIDELRFHGRKRSPRCEIRLGNALAGTGAYSFSGGLTSLPLTLT